jgi:alkylhydroperoxidase family enzyme
MTTRTFEEVFSTRPDLYEPWRDFVGAFWAPGVVDPVALELCRVRVAQLLGSASAAAERQRPAVDAGLRDEQIERLSEWPPADCYTDAQRAALTFAEQFVIDPHGVDDAMRETLQQHFSFPEVVALTEALAVFDGFTRFRLMLCDDTAVERVVEPPAPPAEPLDLPDDADPAISQSVLGEQPEALVAFLRLYGTLWSHGTVEQPLKEIARLRNARITDCGY